MGNQNEEKQEGKGVDHTSVLRTGAKATKESNNKNDDTYRYSNKFQDKSIKVNTDDNDKCCKENVVTTNELLVQARINLSISSKCYKAYSGESKDKIAEEEEVFDETLIALIHVERD